MEALGLNGNGLLFRNLDLHLERRVGPARALRLGL